MSMDVRHPPRLGYNDQGHDGISRESQVSERERSVFVREREAATLDRELEERRQDLEVLEMQLAERARALDTREALVAERERDTHAGAPSAIDDILAGVDHPDSPPGDAKAGIAFAKVQETIALPLRSGGPASADDAVLGKCSSGVPACQKVVGTPVSSFLAGILHHTASILPFQSTHNPAATAHCRSPLRNEVGPGEELTLIPDAVGALRGGKTSPEAGKAVRFVDPEPESPDLVAADVPRSEDTGSVAGSCIGPGRALGQRARLTARKGARGSQGSVLSGGTVSASSCSDEASAELGGG